MLSVSVETEPEVSTTKTETAEPVIYDADATEWIIWAMPRLASICFFAVLFVWIYEAEGGIGTSFLNIFGLHALFMSLFVVVFTQESILAFSAPLFGLLAKISTLQDPISNHSSQKFPRDLALTGNALLYCWTSRHHRVQSPVTFSRWFSVLHNVQSTQLVEFAFLAYGDFSFG